MNLIDLLSGWTPPAVPENIPHGDMPGDKIRIGEGHIAKANTIFPLLIKELQAALENGGKAVVSVFGGSGVGKSEIASLLGYYLGCAGVKSYVISGDNYPRRIPCYNDAERMRCFRTGGLNGMLKAGVYSDAVQAELSALWEAETDAAPESAEGHPWLQVYQQEGQTELKKYLGTDVEQNYDEINSILEAFHRGDEKIWLKRMGRTENECWYSEIDFSDINVLILEWTHGGNPALNGVDIPILLNSTPEETREHRRLRARDGKTDSAFVTMVLGIEQLELDAAAANAKIIISKAGGIIKPAAEEK